MGEPDHVTGFLTWVFGTNKGYACVGYKVRQTGAFQEFFFLWPDEREAAREILSQRAMLGDLYYCPTLLRTSKRTKENITNSRVIWADLDTCPPDALLLKPTALVETSPGRHHAYWALNQTHPGLDVEEINKRIAYEHAEQGCDKSGWDLTQYLRVPGTYNHKYQPDLYQVRVVDYEQGQQYTIEDFNIYPEVEVGERLKIPFPGPEAFEGLSAEQVLAEVQGSVNPRVWRLATEEPEFDEKSGRVDWSKQAWQLQLSLFDAGRTREEVFVVMLNAACNKYERDKRDNFQQLLWADVLRAEEHSKKNILGVAHLDDNVADEVFYVPETKLLTDEEREICGQRKTLVEEYIEWARTVGDAAPQYHEAGAFVILSSLLAGAIALPTSYGKVSPNLWFMILADTTLTRKTTAMDLAIDILAEIDSDIILATDGSIEGLMTSLSMRPGRPSVFLRDEFSGLLEQVSKRDYYAGMLETFTKLYDGKLQKRVLRKETIAVHDPRLILFTGGIKERIYALLGPEHISSGFVPRFCFITAESDVLRLKPLGPPSLQTLEGRDRLMSRLRDLYNHYTSPPVKSEDTDDEKLNFKNIVHEVSLTQAAWQRYNRIEQALLETGLNSSQDYLLTPLLARLAQSGLKAAMLLAASEELHFEEIEVDEHHIVQAFYYAERWKMHAINVLANAGKTATEKELERIYTFVSEFPGVQRSKIMQRFFLTAKTADAIFATLLQRGLLRVERGKGNQQRFYPVRSNRKAKEQIDV